MPVEQPNNRERYRKIDLPKGSAEFWLERAGLRVTFHTTQPNGNGWGQWPRCGSDGCLGEAVIGNLCFPAFLYGRQSSICDWSS